MSDLTPEPGNGAQGRCVQPLALAMILGRTARPSCVGETTGVVSWWRDAHHMTIMCWSGYCHYIADIGEGKWSHTDPKSDLLWR
jgi:hypothetical protein